ncbi:hypothetical protein [Streptomyces sp. NPDC050121]|uniref:hypothetical protein n=1 Tax=Streptomyces sp. NPDC050121 TaxID=3365601 RepID=UPI0037B3CC60
MHPAGQDVQFGQGLCVMDPDEQVRAAIADVFAAFEAGGSAYAVVSAFVGRTFPLRAFGGVWAGQLRWGRLTHARVLGVLNNPCYAGTCHLDLRAAHSGRHSPGLRETWHVYGGTNSHLGE